LIEYPLLRARPAGGMVVCLSMSVLQVILLTALSFLLIFSILYQFRSKPVGVVRSHLADRLPATMEQSLSTSERLYKQIVENTSKRPPEMLLWLAKSMVDQRTTNERMDAVVTIDGMQLITDYSVDVLGPQLTPDYDFESTHTFPFLIISRERGQLDRHTKVYNGDARVQVLSLGEFQRLMGEMLIAIAEEISKRRPSPLPARTREDFVIRALALIFFERRQQNMTRKIEDIGERSSSGFEWQLVELQSPGPSSS
jgi:hypothetical protein